MTGQMSARKYYFFVNIKKVRIYRMVQFLGLMQNRLINQLIPHLSLKEQKICKCQ